jgi:hypothetical protein
MSRTKEGKASFEAASSTANQKQNRAVTRDERELVDAMKKKVKGQSE